MKIKWTLEKRKLSDLKPHKNNPRTFTEEGMKSLEKSFKKIGVAQPINISKDNIILSGHARVKKLIELGEKEVDVLVPDKKLTERQQKSVVLAMNKVVAGEWNFEMLFENFEKDEIEEWGFDWECNDEENEVVEDEAPALKKESIVKKGDLWLLGNHRLKCGDSTVITDVEDLMDGKKADMVFTDPPYNIDYDFSNNGMVQTGQRKARFGKIQNDKMSDDKFNDFINSSFNNLLISLKDGGSYYISAGRESTLTFNLILKDLDFHIQSWIIWKKEHFNISRLDYHPSHEVITYGWKKGKAHNWYSDRSQKDTLEFDRDKNTVHPTQKPIKLLAYLLKNSSKKNQIVLDIFGGSGSTLIACEQLDRKCYIQELDTLYCQVIIERYINFKQNDGKDVFLLKEGKKIPYNEIIKEKQ